MGSGSSTTPAKSAAQLEQENQFQRAQAELQQYKAQQKPQQPQQQFQQQQFQQQQFQQQQQPQQQFQQNLQPQQFSPQQQGQIPPAQWMKHTIGTPFPVNALQVGTDFDGSPLYLARAVAPDGSILIGKTGPSFVQGAHMPMNGREGKVGQYEVFFGVGPGFTIFITPMVGNNIPQGSIVGGKNVNGQPLFCGVTKHTEQGRVCQTPGFIAGDGCVIVFGGNVKVAPGASVIVAVPMSQPYQMSPSQPPSSFISVQGPGQQSYLPQQTQQQNPQYQQLTPQQQLMQMATPSNNSSVGYANTNNSGYGPKTGFAGPGAAGPVPGSIPFSVMGGHQPKHKAHGKGGDNKMLQGIGNSLVKGMNSAGKATSSAFDSTTEAIGSFDYAGAAQNVGDGMQSAGETVIGGMQSAGDGIESGYQNIASSTAGEAVIGGMQDFGNSVENFDYAGTANGAMEAVGNYDYAGTANGAMEAMPSFDIPSYDIPSFDVPSLDVPSVDVPSFEVPSFDVPSFEVPSFDE